VVVVHIQYKTIKTINLKGDKMHIGNNVKFKIRIGNGNSEREIEHEGKIDFINGELVTIKTKIGSFHCRNVNMVSLHDQPILNKELE